MKKFLSKVLTLALVCAIVVTGTSITSEAKGKKSSKKAVATTYSSNAVVNDFVATMLKSNGLVISGKSYNSQQALTLGFSANPVVTVSPMYWQADKIVNGDGSVSDTGSGRCCGFYLYEGGVDGTGTIYGSNTSELSLNEMKAYGFTDFNDNATLNTNGVWNTNAFVANGVNTQYICSWMQSRGLNTAPDVYNYLVASGATFTVDTSFVCYDGSMQNFVCVQCPNLYYRIDGTNTSIYYRNDNLSGVNLADISSDSTSTQWYSGIQH